MPSTITTPVATRIPNDQAAELRAQATRSGLTLSGLVARMVAAELGDVQGDDALMATTAGEEPR